MAHFQPQGGKTPWTILTSGKASLGEIKSIWTKKSQNRRGAPGVPWWFDDHIIVI
jgi:hypothetical protein